MGRSTSRALGKPVGVAAAVAIALLETRIFLVTAACIATGAQLIIIGRPVTASQRLDAKTIDLHPAATAALIPVTGGPFIASAGNFRAAVLLSAALSLWTAFQWIAAKWKIRG